MFKKISSFLSSFLVLPLELLKQIQNETHHTKQTSTTQAECLSHGHISVFAVYCIRAAATVDRGRVDTGWAQSRPPSQLSTAHPAAPKCAQSQWRNKHQRNIKNSTKHIGKTALNTQKCPNRASLASLRCFNADPDKHFFFRALAVTTCTRGKIQNHLALESITASALLPL